MKEPVVCSVNKSSVTPLLRNSYFFSRYHYSVTPSLLEVTAVTFHVTVTWLYPVTVTFSVTVTVTVTPLPSNGYTTGLTQYKAVVCSVNKSSVTPLPLPFFPLPLLLYSVTFGSNGRYFFRYRYLAIPR